MAKARAGHAHFNDGRTVRQRPDASASRVLVHKCMNARRFGGLDKSASQGVVHKCVERRARPLFPDVSRTSALGIEAADSRRWPTKTGRNNVAAFHMSRRIVPGKVRRSDGRQREEQSDERHGGAAHSHSMVAGGFEEMS